MRPVSIADCLRGSSIVGVAVGSFGLAWSVRQTLSLSSANTRKFSPARRLLLLGITHWEQLVADVTGIQRLQMMLNCMRGVWAVEVEQEAFASEFTSVHRFRSWSCGTKMSRACHDRLEGASTPTRASQEESRPPKRGHPVPKSAMPNWDMPHSCSIQRFQTLPYRRAYLCAYLSALCA